MSIKNKHNLHKTWAASLFTMAMAAFMQPATAQSVEGTTYYLPKATVLFTVKVEKTTYTPGRFAPYALRYLKKNVQQEPVTTYRLIGITMQQNAVADTAKHFTLTVDKKHSIDKVSRAADGMLLAINADAKPVDIAAPTFTPAPKPKPLNPNDFMNEDILNAGSTAKMAELSAKEDLTYATAAISSTGGKRISCLKTVRNWPSCCATSTCRSVPSPSFLKALP